MNRIVRPELLDALRPDDPRAVGSRADLRRLNRWLGHDRFLARAFSAAAADETPAGRPWVVVELGAGDGTQLLRLARSQGPAGRAVHAVLVDRQGPVTAETCAGFAACGWRAEWIAAEAVAWLERNPDRVDAIVANLFLHHFPDRALAALLRLVAAKTNRFIACEPCRSPLALAGARCLGLLGCNQTTRHDARLSVAAGFIDRELSARWPADAGWAVSEMPVGLFSHGFVAQRLAAAATRGPNPPQPHED